MVSEKYFKKYLKYKSKYLKLLGGGISTDQTQLTKPTDEDIFLNNLSEKQMTKIIEDLKNKKDNEIMKYLNDPLFMIKLFKTLIDRKIKINPYFLLQNDELAEELNKNITFQQVFSEYVAAFIYPRKPILH